MSYTIADYKVNTLPINGVPNARYYVPNGNGTDIDEYLTDKDGNYRKVSPVVVIGGYEEINEVLIGVVNNSNVTFTTSFNFDPSTTIVFINGIKQKKPVHYNTVGTNTVVFTDSPLVGELLEINYVKL
jgi:hypothetical protein